MKKTLFIISTVCCFISSVSYGQRGRWVPLGQDDYLPVTGNSTIFDGTSDESGAPYVLSNGCVKRYNGIEWQTLGSEQNVNMSFMTVDSIGNVYVACRNASEQISVEKFDGNNWVTLGNANFSNTGAFLFGLTLDKKGVPYVMYGETNPNFAVVVKKFNGSMWVQVGNSITPGWNQINGVITCGSLFFDQTNTPVFYYGDYYYNNYVYQQVYYINTFKLSGNQWNVISGSRIPYEDDTNKGSINLTMDGNGVLYAIYTDTAYSFKKVTVSKFTGTTWQTLGSQGMAIDNPVVSSLRIKTNPGNIPYISISTVSDSVLLMKFINNKWDTIGRINPTDYGFNGIGILNFTQSGILYAFSEGSSAYQVFKFDGTTWEILPGKFYGASSQYLHLKKNPITGELYMAYCDGFTSKITVKKYYSSVWQDVGAEGFSPAAIFSDLDFDSTGIPYVAFCEYGSPYKTSVMKFDGSNWVYLGSPEFSRSTTSNMSLAIDRKTSIPYVMFTHFISYNNSIAYIMKFDGIAWNYLDSIVGSSRDITSCRITSKNNGTECVDYFDNYSSAFNVKTLSGNQLLTVGTTLSGGYSNTIAFGSNDTTYILGNGKIYKSGSNSWTPVYTINSNWIQGVGSVNMATDNSDSLYLVLNGGNYNANINEFMIGKITYNNIDTLPSWFAYDPQNYNSNTDGAQLVFDRDNVPVISYETFTGTFVKKYIDCSASDPEALFSYSVNGNTVSFSDSSTNANNWKWEFGDGTVGYSRFSEHTYKKSGVYNVKLVVSNDCGVDSVIEMDVLGVITGTPTSEVLHTDDNLMAIPNPCSFCELKGTFNVKDLIVTDLLGKQVPVEFLQISTSGYKINFLSDASGILIVKNKRTGEALKLVRQE